jgi:GTP-binding protein
LGLLARYTGSKAFCAENGESGAKQNKYGKHGDDITIDVPVGSVVHDRERERTYTFLTLGETHRVLRGGRGGLGNLMFKSSINRSPEESTKGKKGESGTFFIEVSLIADAGLVGLPNAGKSTLINALTGTASKVGSYPFTTTEPLLGELHGIILADIPGLIEGASHGKGLGHKFLRHINRTRMILHCLDLTSDNILRDYAIIRNELETYSKELALKEEWIVLTKLDLVTEETQKEAISLLKSHTSSKVYIVSGELGINIKSLSDDLSRHLTSQ